MTKAKIRRRKKAAAHPAPKAIVEEVRSVVFIVVPSGGRHTLLVKASDTIESQRDLALRAAGQMPEVGWEVRDTSGKLFDAGYTFRDAQITHGAELYVTMRAGVGG